MVTGVLQNPDHHHRRLDQGEDVGDGGEPGGRVPGEFLKNFMEKSHEVKAENPSLIPSSGV
jgi:hypothetical protein